MPLNIKTLASEVFLEPPVRRSNSVNRTTARRYREASKLMPDSFRKETKHIVDAQRVPGWDRQNCGTNIDMKPLISIDLLSDFQSGGRVFEALTAHQNSA